ncbi:hypothetical protein P7K49_020965 [Saguinus oedipus]|uniref:Uncharacterized protein n=1 Tax=Saguinus oedipus TaxID=9490 RepID=A0ABQ9URA1_SAGOE|nr:hypothetical protein P7K49_020965 [Saguinus oedipus]
MFRATLRKEIRSVHHKFVQGPVEIFMDDEKKLTLHGLQQYYTKLKDNEENRKLFDLDVLEFNQVVIFVKSVQWHIASAQLLVEQNFPAIATHQGAGRFGTKGLAVTFVSTEIDAKILNDVQDCFEVNLSELPEELNISSYFEQTW